MGACPLLESLLVPQIAVGEWCWLRMLGSTSFHFFFLESLVCWIIVCHSEGKYYCPDMRFTEILGCSGVSPFFVFFCSVVAMWLVSVVFRQLSKGHICVILWGCLLAGHWFSVHKYLLQATWTICVVYVVFPHHCITDIVWWFKAHGNFFIGRYSVSILSVI